MRLVLAIAASVSAAALRIPTFVDRREAARLSAAAASTALLGGLGTPAALAADNSPVLVLGASGGTGDECVKYLLMQKRPCIAATRTGAYEAAPSQLLTTARGDVTSESDLRQLIKPGLGGVIFAASASRKEDAKKKSGTKQVDRDGVITCAKLCRTGRAAQRRRSWSG